MLSGRRAITLCRWDENGEVVSEFSAHERSPPFPYLLENVRGINAETAEAHITKVDNHQVCDDLIADRRECVSVM